jgi:hypothetical protein
MSQISDNLSLPSLPMCTYHKVVNINNKVSLPARNEDIEAKRLYAPYLIQIIFLRL